MTSKRAAAGGEVAPNGEFYKGGQFINTIEANPKKGGRPAARKTGRRQVAPFVWEMQPEPGARSLFTMLAGVGAKWAEDGKTLEPYLPYFEGRDGVGYQGETIAEVQALCDRYNAGEKWA